MNDVASWTPWFEAYFDKRTPKAQIYVWGRVDYDGVYISAFIQAPDLKACNQKIVERMSDPEIFWELHQICFGDFGHHESNEVLDELGLTEDAEEDEQSYIQTIQAAFAAKGDTFVTDIIQSWEDRDAEGAYTFLAPLMREQLVGLEEALTTTLKKASSAEKATWLAESIATGNVTMKLNAINKAVELFPVRKRQKLTVLIQASSIWTSLFKVIKYAHERRNYGHAHCSDVYESLFEQLGAKGVTEQRTLQYLTEEPARLKALLAQPYFYLKGDSINSTALAQDCEMLLL